MPRRRHRPLPICRRRRRHPPRATIPRCRRERSICSRRNGGCRRRGLRQSLGLGGGGGGWRGDGGAELGGGCVRGNVGTFAIPEEEFQGAGKGGYALGGVFPEL